MFDRLNYKKQNKSVEIAGYSNINKAVNHN
jgi:hypothetical protein